MADSNHWTSIPLPEGETVRHRIGPVSIFLKKFGNEIWSSHHLDEKMLGEPAEPDDKTGWTRTALREESEVLQFLPVFPDRPVVIDSENTFRIFKDARSKIYSRVPVWIRVVPQNMPDVIIAEIPATELSSTWFGTFTEGELCYALSSTVRQKISPDLFQPHRIICPITIDNQSGQELRFEKMCLRVESLSIYQNKLGLWGGESRIVYNGKEVFSDTEILPGLPVEAEGGWVVGKPRSPGRGSITGRTFKRLWEITVPGFS